jgi:antitoxin component YwqK of YwqJK toxin-antitoxin module
MEGWLKNDLGDSTWRYYHENGALKATGPEKNGEKTGLWKFYGPDGKLDSEGEYVNGQPNGAWRYYHENGELASEGQQRNGVKEGSGSSTPTRAGRRRSRGTSTAKGCRKNTTPTANSRPADR